MMPTASQSSSFLTSPLQISNIPVNNKLLSNPIPGPSSSSSSSSSPSSSSTRIPFPLPIKSSSTPSRKISNPPTKPDPSAFSTSHHPSEVTMLKEQLAKLQAELRMARGQPLERSPSSTNLLKSRRSRTFEPTSSSLLQSPPLPSPTPAPLTPSLSRSKSTRRSPQTRSTNSEPSEGLSIRLISAPGLVPSSSTLLNDFPTTDVGFVRDAQGNWVPLHPVNSSSGPHDLQPGHTTPLPNGSRRSSPKPSSVEDGRGLSRIPISAVSLGRVLVGDTSSKVAGPATEDDLLSEGQHSGEGLDEDETSSTNNTSRSSPAPAPRRRKPRPVPSLSTLAEAGGAGEFDPKCLSPGHESHTSLSVEGDELDSRHPTRQHSHSRANPFFGSGAGRDRGAMIHQSNAADKLNSGNTGRVITNLQSDLLYAKTALDQSKSQLRLSQRAVESLTRQTEDLKESMSRLRLENEGLSKMLARKERTVSELMDRIKKSESELTATRAEKKEN